MNTPTLNPSPTPRTGPRIKHTSAALALGFLSMFTLQMATSGPAMAAPVGQTTPTPYYFSVANWANSPLPDIVPTVVSIGGTGTGATAIASLMAGSVADIFVTNGGTGYDANTPVSITGSGINASATATVDATGAITAFTVISGGSGYGVVGNPAIGMRKFVDTLPGLTSAGVNNLGQYIPVASPDTTTYLGSDYYEIAVVEYKQQMHSDLPAAGTRLRGYVQLATTKVPGNHVALTYPDGTPILINGAQAYGVDKPHYLGPVLSATKDRPVRLLFRNLLPIGQGGDLFLPVDTSILGSGRGPTIASPDADPQNPLCGASPKPAGCYTENRALLHLHGGLSPWISDGTPHQWITPATENGTKYPLKGVSTKNVSDMPDPGAGASTYFYTNQQSSRLMFYHDHAWGITRLNVYAGEVAPYLITDDTEKRLVQTEKVIPDALATLPLVIQDKTFVPPMAQIAVTDPLWDPARWGDFGQLWMPHVYVPAQNPGDASGVNQFGRWAYGPWFWPPLTTLDYPPIANTYYDSTCNSDLQWCEPPLMPAVPFVSFGMESFHDTPVVNGTAYPKTEVAAKAYRLRILNGSNDRFFNLSLYKAVDANGLPCDGATAPAASPSGEVCTEVALNPAEVTAALTDPTVFPTPIATTAGPSWIQIGNESGFLPAPAVIPPQPMTWVTDPTVFNAGNADKHSLLLGPAERADVIVDFSKFAGQTLILYNDAPAAFPARDPRLDYYTGNADLTDTGGAPPTQPGYGPNTRTMMKIKVLAGAAAPFNLTALQAAFAHHLDATGKPAGAFETSQHPIIVGQSVYNSAYGTNFMSTGPDNGTVQIFNEFLNFKTLAAGAAGPSLTIPLERKAIHDEMNAAWDPIYGRMGGMLGLEAPNAQPGQAQNLVLYPFINPPTEVLKGIELPPGVSVTPISSATDGTQIWKITHNGVDTHPIHFHLMDVQLLNRVGWDGIVRKPDANEIGWKETVRISPLEDTIVALRPFMPKLPFGVPDSIRPLNPAEPIGSTAGFNSTDANGNPVTPITNVMTNFEAEYVWHCHILSHEEMDMMHPVSALVNPVLPYPPAVTYTRNTGGVVLTWIDRTPINYATLASWGDPANEIGFRIDRATVGNTGTVGTYATIGKTLANQTTYTDTTAVAGRNYRYRVVAYNAAGDAQSAPVGGPAVAIPLAPTNAVATLQAGPRVSLTWRDNATTESYFLIERKVDGGAFTLIAQAPALNATGNVTFVDTFVTSTHSYQYRVAAVSTGGTSAYVNSNTITASAVPAAPSSLTGTAVTVSATGTDTITLNWVDNATTETGFTIERAYDPAFTIGLTTSTVAANTTTLTQTGLYRGVPHYYRVRADNLGGPSPWSNVFFIIAP